MRKLFSAITCTALVAVLVVPFVAGCRHNVNSSNPQVVAAANILTASQIVDTVSIGLVSADKSLASLEAAGEISVADATSVKLLLIKIAKQNDRAILAIRAAQAGTTANGWRDEVAAIAAVAGTVNPATLGFKSAGARQTFTLALATLQGALATIPLWVQHTSPAQLGTAPPSASALPFVDKYSFEGGF